jgi:hypothetical protein
MTPGDAVGDAARPGGGTADTSSPSSPYSTGPQTPGDHKFDRTRWRSGVQSVAGSCGDSTQRRCAPCNSCESAANRPCAQFVLPTLASMPARLPLHKADLLLPKVGS